MGLWGKVANGKLTISIDIPTLCFAIRLSPYVQSLITDHETGMMDETKFKIADEAAFARSVLQALEHEEEDGTTLIHKMLDAAGEYAIEQGLDGIEYA